MNVCVLLSLLWLVARITATDVRMRKCLSAVFSPLLSKQEFTSELNVDNWNDNCEAKSEAKSPRLLRGLQVDFNLTRNFSYAAR